jgi:uncharacterized membrane protein YfcA
MLNSAGPWLSWLMFPTLGALAGVLAGLLGIGGGLVLVAALVWWLPMQGVPVQFTMQTALATSLASIVFTALSSARSHARRGSVLWPTVFALVPGLLLGGWFGSQLAVRLPGDVLRWIVAIYCLLAGTQLLLGQPGARTGNSDSTTEPVPRDPLIAACGLLIGAVSAVVGIGGGSMTVPLLIWRGVRPVRAVGTSSACGVAIGLASAVGYALHGPPGGLPGPGNIGFVDLPAAAAIAVASVLAAPLGVRLAHRLSGPALRRVFAVFLFLVGLSLALGG